MTTQENNPRYVWQKTYDGSYTLFDCKYNQSMHSQHGALSECRHVYIDPTLELLQSSQDKVFSVLEIGFGIGLNFRVWLEALLQFNPALPVTIEYESFESHPELLDFLACNLDSHTLFASHTSDASRAELTQAFLKWIQKHPHQRSLTSEINMSREIKIASEIKIGNAPDLILTCPDNHFDVVWQDAFSEKVNQELWTIDFFKEVKRVLKPNGTLLTYSVASAMRRRLEELGFECQKRRGFGGKRECLLATLKK